MGPTDETKIIGDPSIKTEGKKTKDSNRFLPLEVLQGLIQHHLKSSNETCQQPGV